MTAEVQFEQQFDDVARTRTALQRCEKQLTQIPKVLTELCSLLKECTLSLDQVISSPEVDAGVTEEWRRAKQRYLAFANGTGLTTFTTYFQKEVINRLDALSARTETAYVAGKDRRDAREKFLRNSSRKSAPEKVQKKKDVFSATDQDFVSLYRQLNLTRCNVAGPIVRSFFLGYSSVTFAIANALCASGQVVSTEALVQESRVAARVPVSAVEERGYRPAKPTPGTIISPVKPPPQSNGNGVAQRRLSDLRRSGSSSDGGGGGVTTSEGLSAAFLRPPPTPVTPSRAHARGIPIYYNSGGAVAEVANVVEALPNEDDDNDPDYAAVGGEAVAVRAALAANTPVHGQARRSSAPTTAHFYGSGELELAGAPPRRSSSLGSADDNNATDSQYREFFKDILNDG